MSFLELQLVLTAWTVTFLCATESQGREPSGEEVMGKWAKEVFGWSPGPLRILKICREQAGMYKGHREGTERGHHKQRPGRSRLCIWVKMESKVKIHKESEQWNSLGDDCVHFLMTNLPPLCWNSALCCWSTFPSWQLLICFSGVSSNPDTVWWSVESSPVVSVPEPGWEGFCLPDAGGYETVLTLSLLGSCPPI